MFSSGPLTLPGRGLRGSQQQLPRCGGRLKRGVTFEQARAELRSLPSAWPSEYPETNAETGISFFRMRDNMSPRFRLMLMALGGASLCLLLLTCANLANLLLARAAARERELAVGRRSAPAGNGWCASSITESVILTLSAARRACSWPPPAVPLFASLVPHAAHRDRTQPGPAGGRVRGLFTTLTALGFGLFPALRAGRAPHSPRFARASAQAAERSSVCAPFW